MKEPKNSSKNKFVGKKSISKQLEDYSITLDIKNNVIAELQNNLANKDQLLRQAQIESNKNQKELSTLIERLPPLSEVSLQLFWATSDMKFDETKSVHRLIHLDNTTPTTFIFDLPVIKSIYFLRFDLGDKMGFLNIHSIEIKNNAGELIWLWDKSTINFKNGVLLIESSKYFDSKIVQLSTTYDPQIILQINSEGALQNFSKSTVEITLSKFDLKEIELLNNQIASLLSFHSEKQINQLNESIEKLTDEKEALKNEIVLTNNSLNKSKQENFLYNKSIKNYEILIEQNKSDKINFEKDKIFLTNEIGIKNEILNKLLIEKERIEKELKEKGELLIKASNDIDIAEKEKQRLGNQLNDTTNYSKQLSEKIKHLEKEIVDAKNYHIKNTETLNAFIQELTQNNSFLHSEINIKNDASTRLIYENEILEKKYIETEKKLQEVIANLALKEQENKKLHLELTNSLDKSTQQLFQLNELKELLNDERTFYANNKNAYDMQLSEMIETESKLLSEMNLLKLDSDFLWKNYENRTFLQVCKFRISRRINMMKNRNT